MIRVLFLIRSLDIGGTQRQLVELVKNIDHARFSIHVVIFYDDGAFQPLIENIPGVHVTSLGKSNRWDLLFFFAKLISVIQTYQPHVIQSYLDVPNSFNVLAGKLLGIKTCLGVRASYIDFSQYDWTAFLVYKTSAFLSHFSNKVIANSKAGEKYYAGHGYSAKNMFVIHNGIDTRTFHPDKLEGAGMRSKWGISESEKIVGIVGRLDPMKDHPTFLHAAVLVSKQISDCRFICVGRGSQTYLEEMKTLATSLLGAKKVLWINDCDYDDIPTAYNVLDVLVSSSSYGEGLSNALGEGMASGVPCVVTDVGDSAFVIGETGLVVPPKNPGALADAICQILLLSDQERLVLGQKARQRILDNFSIEKMTSAYEAVFENMATA